MVAMAARRCIHRRRIAHPSTSFFGVVNSAVVVIIDAMSQRWALMINLCVLLWPAWCSSAEPLTLDVRPQLGGGIKAVASMVFPVEPAVIQGILGDYRRWPDLFEIRMRIAESHEAGESVFTDIRIAHSLWPGERRLICETRRLSGGGLLTELRGGDFKQYRREWTLAPVEGGRHTRALFELLVEIETAVPDWMIAIAMRQELNVHFRILREKALSVTTGER